MQETWVWSLIRENPICHRATEPATSTEPVLQILRAATSEAHAPQVCALQQEKPLQWEAHALQLQSSHHKQRKAHAAMKIQPAKDE